MRNQYSRRAVKESGKVLKNREGKFLSAVETTLERLNVILPEFGMKINWEKRAGYRSCRPIRDIELLSQKDFV
jgi:hypothetical protein